jgi:hypothetical protein
MISKIITRALDIPSGFSLDYLSSLVPSGSSAIRFESGLSNVFTCPEGFPSESVSSEEGFNSSYYTWTLYYAT